MIYANKILLLHKLLKDEEWEEENLQEPIIAFKEIDHNTANYIDDSNSIIKFEDLKEANNYLDKFFRVLKVYYYDSKLKINVT